MEEVNVLRGDAPPCRAIASPSRHAPRHAPRHATPRHAVVFGNNTHQSSVRTFIHTGIVRLIFFFSLPSSAICIAAMRPAICGGVQGR